MCASLTKPQWRDRVLAARRALAAPTRESEATALAEAVHRLTGTVCAYCPTGTEPGSLRMLDALTDAGAEVLLPVVPPCPGPLRWAAHTGATALRRGRAGMFEPPGPSLEPAAVSRADALLVPALAVDARGTRLGRGAGYYDRTLTMVRPATAVIAVLRDEELVEGHLPAEPHDVPVSATLTPARGLAWL